MSNAICKTLIAATVIALTASCGTDQRKADAQALYNSATTALEAGNADQCLALLDSLDANFRGVNDVIAQSIALRPRAIEMQSIGLLADCDSLVEMLTDSVMHLQSRLVNVNIDGGISYMVANGFNSSFMNATGISGRVDDTGRFYIVSSVRPAGNLRHTSLAVSTSDGNAATTDTIAYDGDINYRINDSETVTFANGHADRFGEFVANNVSKPLTLAFVGESGRRKNVRLSTSEAKAIADAWLYSDALSQLRRAQIEHDRLTAIIDHARASQSN